MRSASSISCDSVSVEMINKYGDSGSPYLIPREGWKKGVGLPLTKIAMDEVVMQDIMSV